MTDSFWKTILAMFIIALVLIYVNLHTYIHTYTHTHKHNVLQMWMSWWNRRQGGLGIQLVIYRVRSSKLGIEEMRVSWMLAKC